MEIALAKRWSPCSSAIRSAFVNDFLASPKFIWINASLPCKRYVSASKRNECCSLAASVNLLIKRLTSFNISGLLDFCKSTKKISHRWRSALSVNSQLIISSLTICLRISLAFSWSGEFKLFFNNKASSTRHATSEILCFICLLICCIRCKYCSAFLRELASNETINRESNPATVLNLMSSSSQIARFRSRASTARSKLPFCRYINEILLRHCAI